jgi:ribosomal protein L40E
MPILSFCLLALISWTQIIALVIPIILRPVHWEDAPFSKLKVLPKEGKPVTRWRSRDEAFLDVAEGIREAVKHLSKTSSSNKSSPMIKKKIQVCGNCKVPISLGMYCWKCGIPTVQICNKCGEKNSIERETCHRCGILLIQVCSNCSEKNNLEADFCWRCGIPLKQICDKCGTYNHLSATICSVCGILLDSEWERDWDL